MTCLGLAQAIVLLAKHAPSELCSLRPLLPAVWSIAGYTARGGIGIGVGIFCIVWGLIGILMHGKLAPGPAKRIANDNK